MPKPAVYGTRPHALTLHIHIPITLLVPYTPGFAQNSYGMTLLGLHLLSLSCIEALSAESDDASY